MPESVANTSVQVMYETSVPGQARLEEVCATLSLEVHTSCACGCQQLECSSKQVSTEAVSRGETVIILSSRSLMTEPVSADALTSGPEASASCNTIRSVQSAISIEMMKRFPLQLWDPDSCECRCRPEEWKECQTGYTYDGVYSCQCLPVVIEIGRESELCNSHH